MAVRSQEEEESEMCSFMSMGDQKDSSVWSIRDHYL